MPSWLDGVSRRLGGRTVRWAVLCSLGLTAVPIATAPAMAAGPPEVFVKEYGEYVVQREEAVAGPQPGSTGVTDRATSVGARLVRRTARVQAMPCRRFGVWFQVRPGTAGLLPVTSRLTHPLMVRPDGRRGEVESDEAMLSDEPTLSGFSFNYDWEMVPGTWTFAILSGGTVLAEQVFEVEAPPPGLASPPGDCEAPTS